MTSAGLRTIDAPEGLSVGPTLVWDQIKIGDRAAFERTVRENDLYLFAHASGDLNPTHQPGADLDGDGAPDTVAHGMWLAALLSALIGNRLPGPGAAFRSQSLQFHAPARVGDQLKISVEVKEKRAAPIALLTLLIERVDGVRLISGEAEIAAPLTAPKVRSMQPPNLLIDTHAQFDVLIAAAKRANRTLRTAIVCPEDESALNGAVLGAQEGLILPILIGDREKILKTADRIGADLSTYQIREAAHEDAAAALAVALVLSGEAECVMKGKIHTDQLLAHVVKKEGGLRDRRRISHVFALDVPGLEHFLFISDAAINIAPDLLTKADIVQNAIDLALACGTKEARVGVLSAVETINPNIPSTLDAAALSKMAERGQITGGFVDGPLAMDNAIDLDAARTKGIASIVAGRANVLIAPNLEAGNMLAKQLTFLAHAEPAGLVVGARAPVILTSRADDARARLASCALAIAYEHWRRTGTSVLAAGGAA